MSTTGATEEEIAVVPGIDFKAPIIGRVSFPNLIESPGFNSYCNIMVASIRAPPDS